MPMIYSAVFNMEMNLKKQDSVIADKRKMPVLALEIKDRYLHLLW